MKTQSSPSPKKGFTLVELLVVIAIIGTLTGISATAVIGFRKSADKTTALNSIRQLQIANIAYSSDHNGEYVSANGEYNDGSTVQIAVWYENPEYLSSLTAERAQDIIDNESYEISESFLDPVAIKEGGAGSQQLYGSFAYNIEDVSVSAPIIEGFRTAQVADPARSMAFISADGGVNAVIDFADSGTIAYRHSDKAVVAFYDGHSELLRQTDIENKGGGASSTFWDANQADN